jgi:hypothetical protein
VGQFLSDRARPQAPTPEVVDEAFEETGVT